MDQYHLPARDLDPLWVSSLEAQRSYLAFQNRGATLIDERDSRECRLFIARGERGKQGFEGGGADFRMFIPNLAADAHMQSEWYDLTFVEYLRLCFQWGGFPGLEARSRKPMRELAILTEGLLPI